MPQTNPEATISITETRQDHATVTRIEISEHVGIATEDRWIHLWDTHGREVRIRPLTVEQAEALAEDLGYDSLASWATGSLHFTFTSIATRKPMFGAACSGGG
jgi:hypothetical protein